MSDLPGHEPAPTGPPPAVSQAAPCPSQPPGERLRVPCGEPPNGSELAAKLRWVGAGLAFGAWVPLLWAASLVRPVASIHWMMRLACSWVVAVTGTRLQVRGLDTLPADGGFMLVSNHVNSFDPMVLYMTVPRHMVAIEKASHFSWPFYGGMIRRWGNLPVAPRNPELVARSMARAAALLQQGTPVFVFPEGTRSRGGGLGPFRKGSFALALEAQVPLIPVVMKGAERIFRQGSSSIYGGDQEVIFLPPVPLEPYAGNPEGLADAVRSIVEDELARVLPTCPAAAPAGGEGVGGSVS